MSRLSCVLPTDQRTPCACHCTSAQSAFNDSDLAGLREVGIPTCLETFSPAVSTAVLTMPAQVSESRVDEHHDIPQQFCFRWRCLCWRCFRWTRCLIAPLFCPNPAEDQAALVKATPACGLCCHCWRPPWLAGTADTAICARHQHSIRYSYQKLNISLSQVYGTEVKYIANN